MTRLISHTKKESTTERYRDMIMQKTNTTDVDPIVSALEGKVTFLSSDLTSDKNSTMRLQSLPINAVNLSQPTD